jgi:hypothetical protein
MTEVVGSRGPWSALIGGVLLIFTAVQNPEGIAGATRARAAAARARRGTVSSYPAGAVDRRDGDPSPVSVAS